MNEIEKLCEPDLKERIKKEVIDRVAELQKITELRQKYKE